MPFLTPTPSPHPTRAVGQEPKLLDRLRERVRRLKYSIRIEHAYADWVIKGTLPFKSGAEVDWQHASIGSSRLRRRPPSHHTTR